MKKKLLKIFLVLFIIIALAGVYFHFYPKKARNLLIPKVDQVENIAIKVVGDTARFKLLLKLENKGLFKMNIDSINYNVKFDTATLLSRAQDLDVVLKPGGSDTFLLPAHLPFKRLMKQIKHVQDKDSVQIISDIRIVYSTILGRVSLPFKKNNTIAVPIPPKFELEKLEYTGRDKKTLYFNLYIRMDNQGKIDLTVSDLKYDLKFEDLFTANGSYPKTIKVNPHSVIVEPLPIEVHVNKELKTLYKIIAKEKVNYDVRITGQAQANKLGKEKTAVEIFKSGSTVLKKK